MIKFALFGAGRIGRVHAFNLAQNNNAHLKYVVDINASAATNLAERLGAKAVSVENALADSGLDAVIIASATTTHTELIQLSANARKAILCEKPLDLDVARARLALEAVAQNGVSLFMAFNRRFDPDYSALRDALASGVIGNPELILITSRDREPPPNEYLLQSGPIFRHMTIHEIDLFRWLTGEEPIEVHATGSSFVFPELDCGPDTVVVTLKSSSGVIGVINNVLRSSFGYDQRLEVQGEHGVLQVDNHKSSHVVVDDRSGRRSAGPPGSFIERFAAAYKAELNLFISNLCSGKEMHPDGTDGLRASLIAECAQRAYEIKASVSVPG
jgi:myo-inositol 2-dehydrogenase/D-chiro-inositol 1-dehydrogenase